MVERRRERGEGHEQGDGFYRIQCMRSGDELLPSRASSSGSHDVDTWTRLERARNVTEAVRSLGQCRDRPADKADSTIGGIGYKGASVDMDKSRRYQFRVRPPSSDHSEDANSDYED